MSDYVFFLLSNIVAWVYKGYRSLGGFAWGVAVCHWFMYNSIQQQN